MTHNLSEMLQERGCLRKMFQAIEFNLSAAVLSISEISNSFKGIPLPLQEKNSNRSEYYRKSGNDEFKKKNYNLALSLYNLALMNAPPGSYSMGQAYYNRSTLLYKLGKHNECMHDVKQCEKCEIPPDLKEKVWHRTEEIMCKFSSSLSSFFECDDIKKSGDYENYFKLRDPIHPKIPCASASVEIKDGKILAVKEIKAGEVISAETAFASCVQNTDIPLLCHYCHRFSLILNPCPGCCYAMFCSTACSKESYEKFHKLECKIYRMGILEGVRMRVALQAVLKALVASNGWTNLFTQVKMVEKSKEYYIEGPYESSAYLNLCTPLHYEQLTRYGVLFDIAVQTSLIVHVICSIKSIMPQEKSEKMLVKQFLAEQITDRAAKTNMNIMSGAAICRDTGKDTSKHILHDTARGLFPFSKLYRHDCHPNTQSFGVGRELIVVALTDISPGTEITTSYWQHFTQQSRSERKSQLFLNFGIICKCRVCLGWPDWPASEKIKRLKDRALEKMKEDVERGVGDPIKYLDDMIAGMSLCHANPKSEYFELYFSKFSIAYREMQARLSKQFLLGVIDPYKERDYLKAI